MIDPLVSLKDAEQADKDARELIERANERRGDPTRGGRRLTDKIACPRCGCLQSTVMRARPTISIQVTTEGYWRRRECASCHQTFETDERVRAIDQESAAS